MKHRFTGLMAALLASSIANSYAEANNQDPSFRAQQTNPWYRDAQQRLQEQNKAIQKITTQAGKAKNIILFVGDGMSLETIVAARILQGQQQGASGEENLLSFEAFPFSGFSKTYNVNMQVPDSAGTMTAMMTGVKTDAGIINVSEAVEEGSCQSQLGNELISALDLAEAAGLATGVVSTARITHATPAATYANAADRDWEDDSSLPDEAKKLGCQDIAQQLVNFEQRLPEKIPGATSDGLEVVFGGGRRHFLPQPQGKRNDGKNLVEAWQAQYPNGHYVDNLKQFTALKKSTPVLGLFSSSHMHYQQDRPTGGDGEPSLAQMTKKAIELLKPNKQGFFLMVESGRIDHAHHAGNAFNALNDTIALSDAVNEALKATNTKDTLIIVTADHGHVMTIAGYPHRGNPILGKVAGKQGELTKAKDGLPYTTLTYANGRGFQDLKDERDADASYDHDIHAGRHDLSKVDTQAPGFHQEALIPLGSETHSGSDVAVYASGPSAHLVTGVHEQNMIFHIMNFAGALEQKAKAATAKNKR